MQVASQDNSLSSILTQRYDNSLAPIEPTTNAEAQPSTPHLDYKIQDAFSPSQDYQKVQKAKDYIKGALKDSPSFLALADRLKRDDIITPQEKITMDFLAKKSKKMDFESFDALSKNPAINFEMRQAISKLTQKLQMINYLNGNLMAS